MSFATPQMTSGAVEQNAFLPTTIVSTRSGNSDVLDFKGAIGTDLPIASEAAATNSVNSNASVPRVDIKAEITPVEESGDLEHLILQRALNDADMTKTNAKSNHPKYDDSLGDYEYTPDETVWERTHDIKDPRDKYSAEEYTRYCDRPERNPNKERMTPKAFDVTAKESLLLQREFKAMCVGSKEPSFDSWVTANAQRKSISSKTGGNAMLHKQYLDLCAKCVPGFGGVHTQSNLHTRLCKLETAYEEHEAGLMNHTSVLNKLNLEERLSKLETCQREHESGLLNHTSVLQKTADHMKQTMPLQQRLNAVETKQQQHEEGLLNHTRHLRSSKKSMEDSMKTHAKTAQDVLALRKQLKELDLGLQHHTEVLQTSVDGLKSHHEFLSGIKQQQRETAKINQDLSMSSKFGVKCTDKQLQCYNTMENMLQTGV